MRWIAIAIALGACTTDASEMFTMSFTEHRADTALSVNGTMIDGGGAVPRSLSITFDFAQVDAPTKQYLVETFGGGAKLAELAVVPRSCATETVALTVNADGTITLATDTCTP